MDKEEIWEKYFEEYNNILRNTLYEIKENLHNPKARQSWTLIPSTKIKKCWEDFVKYGFVRNGKMLEDIISICIENIIKLSVNTELCGHKETFPTDEMKDIGITEDQLNNSDYLWCNEAGQWRISDYAIDPLEKILYQLFCGGTSEERILLVDQILNVVHQRSDLASWFVEGGSEFLCLLSGIPEEISDT